MKKFSIAKEIVNTIIKNSEVIQPYVKPKHYQRGLLALNVLHLALSTLAKKEQ